MGRRVVITGLGVISPIGTGKNNFLKGLKEGKNGVKEIPYFDMTDYKLNRGAIVEGFTENSYTMSDGRVESEPANVYGLYAAKEAYIDSKINLQAYDKERIGVAVATSLGSIDGKMKIHKKYLDSMSYKDIDLEAVFESCSTPAGVISKEYGCLGPNLSVSTACAAGTNSVGCGFDMIKDGTCDVVIAGGTDPFSELSYSGFLSLQTITKNCLSPFDANRSGIDIGEGAAIMILEELESALSRGANIYAEILGYGISNDAYHATSPDPNAGGAIRCIELGLKKAGISPEDVDYINAHGTGTKFNDAMEMKAITHVFGEAASAVAISSTKSMHGHMLGCAGSIETIVCALAIKEEFIPATINTKEIMPEYKDYNVVIGKAVDKKIDIAVSNSFAFAGNTASIVIGRYKG